MAGFSASGGTTGFGGANVSSSGWDNPGMGMDPAQMQQMQQMMSMMAGGGMAANAAAMAGGGVAANAAACLGMAGMERERSPRRGQFREAINDLLQGQAVEPRVEEKLRSPPPE